MAEITKRPLLAVETAVNDGLGRAADTLALIARAVREPLPDEIGKICASAQELRSASRRTDTDLIELTAQPDGKPPEPRRWLALMQLAQHQGLIANQFDLIAEQLRQIGTETADLQQTAMKLAEMSELAALQLRHALDAFNAGDVAAAEATELEDDAIDRLNHEVFRATLDLDSHAEHRELAYRHVLIARSIERIGDNAVDIAEQTAFLETAQPREFTDASTPHKRLI